MSVPQGDEPRAEPRGLFEGFEGYLTPTDEDYQELLTKGMVVPDANVLLNLYRYNAQTRSDLLTVLRSLEDRLWVPHQVIVEFWRNREAALRDPSDTGKNTVEALEDFCRQSVEVMRTWANRVALPVERRNELQNALQAGYSTVTNKIDEYVADEALDSTLNTGNDPVIKDLATVIHGRTGSALDAQSHEDAVREAKRRIEAKLPPGYKDKSKDDSHAAGDYILWEQTLREAARRRHHVLLVTGDVKEDWWRRERGEARGPRLELVDELRQRAGVRLFMLRPESLLIRARDLLDVDVQDESVQDAERVDRLISADEWTETAVSELLRRLDSESYVQALAIRYAAKNGGFVDRDKIYEFGNYDKDRMLRGFSRPATRTAQRLKEYGFLSNDATENILTAVYDPDISYVQASGFRIPTQIIPLVQSIIAHEESDPSEGSS